MKKSQRSSTLRRRSHHLNGGEWKTTDEKEHKPHIQREKQENHLIFIGKSHEEKYAF